MAGATIVVLVMLLAGIAFVGLIVLVACSAIANRSGQRVKSVSLSFHRGFTAELYPDSDPAADKNG